MLYEGVGPHFWRAELGRGLALHRYPVSGRGVVGR